MEKEFCGWINEKYRIAWVQSKPIESSIYDDFPVADLMKELKKHPTLTVMRLKEMFHAGYSNTQIIKVMGLKVSTYYAFLSHHKLKNPNNR